MQSSDKQPRGQDLATPDPSAVAALPGPAMWGRTICPCRQTPVPRAHAGVYRAVFLDRDGTLIVDKPYCADPSQIELLPGVVAGLTLLRDAGYLLIVVTNQSGIARGYFGERALRAMHRRLNGILASEGVFIAAYYFCPHHVDGHEQAFARRCGCRKPAPGMILQAAHEWCVDVGRSWMVGNSPIDAQAAIAAGCRPLLVGRESAGAGRSSGSFLAVADEIIASDGFGRSAETAARRRARPA